MPGKCHSSPSLRRFARFFASLLIASLLSTRAHAAPPDYLRDIKPLFEKHCYECHGPQKQKSSYRLDQRDIALRGGDSGHPAIIPHSASKSPLIQFVSGEDDDMLMPPAKSKKPPLTPAEIDTLKAWINAGPIWPDSAAGAGSSKPHWSLMPLTRPAIPGNQPNPIDSFILDKLKSKHLSPSPQADRRTLIRRLYYDLIGLPPTQQQVASFVADLDPKAYEKLVDTLLASPRYGEHWARHWLDVASYADTHGNDHDYARFNAWPYRDYVIRSFNADKPYARFVQEQIAGDALFPNDPQATVALGFLAAGPWDDTLLVTVREDTVDHRMGQNLDRDNYVTTVMSTFQSATVHCARCHNHKFDPISQKEYYALQAVFAGIDRTDRPFDSDPAIHQQRQHLLTRQRALKSPDAALLASLDSPQIAQQVAAWEDQTLKRELTWQPLEVTTLIASGGASFTRQSDGSWFVSGNRPDRDTYIITAKKPAGKITAFRLEVLPDDRLASRGPGRADNGHFHLTEFKAFTTRPGVDPGAAPISFSRAAADVNEGPDMSAAQAIDNNNDTHWGIHPHYGQPHTLIVELKTPTEFAPDAALTILLEHLGKATGHGIGRFRLSATTDADPASTLTPLPAKAADILKIPPNSRTREQRRDLALAILTVENDHALTALPPPQLVYAIASDFAPRENFKPAKTPRPIHLLIRGDINRPADLVPAGALSCMPGLSGDLAIANPADESARRAALARWLTDDRNVLTWRSIVNRVWHYHFGRGICDSPNDFGKMGGTPTHPELLDYLAVWFRDDAKGSIKKLHRLIVTSQTYQQSSDSTLSTQHSALAPSAHRPPPAAYSEIDSDNRLLWHMDRPRLTAEEVRDSVLQFSGQLDLTMGGPSAIQFLSRGNATFMTSDPAFLDYDHFDPDNPANRRRAIYRFVFRTVPDPFMDALDAPDGAATTPARGASTTPIQAFAMLNDPFLLRQSKHIAEKIQKTAHSPDEQATAAYELILQRLPTEKERATLADFIQKQGLPTACHVLLNSNEFLYLD